MRLRKYWLERKRNCLDVLSQIGEARGATNKRLMEDIGLETDEDYGVKKDNFPPL